MSEEKKHPRIQELPPPLGEGRVESGAIQFGADWPALHLRGDDSFAFLIGMEMLLERAGPLSAMDRLQLAQVEYVINLILDDVLHSFSESHPEMKEKLNGYFRSGRNTE